MIQDTMRKHRRLFIAILLALIIGPFVFLFGNSSYTSIFDIGPKVGGEAAVALVGDRPISAETFRNAVLSERQQRAQFGQPASMQQLVADGTALQVLEALVGSELITKQAEESGYDFDRDYLVEKMKDWPEFKNEQGRFDPKRWNDVVRSKQNWNMLYDMERRQLARNLVLERAKASARVLDADLRKQFEEENTKLEIRYIALAPKIEPTEEQIKETYDANPEAYQIPEKRVIEFVPISIAAPKPDMADELVERARNGEDFATLAAEHSQAGSKEDGGDIGWLTESPTLPDFQRPALALQKGEVSDPIEGPTGYYIYKVEDERTSEVTGQRDVKVREILVRGELPEAEEKAAQEKADRIAAKAKETGDLAAAAAEEGLEVKTSGEFSFDSLNIENIPDADARIIRNRLGGAAAGELTEPIRAMKNLYVAKVMEVIPPVPQPLEAVRERVLDDTVRRIEFSEEHQKKVQELAESIRQNAKTLDEIAAQHPDLDATIETVPAFTVKDYSFGSGPLWNPRDIYALFASKEPGALAGPITDFQGKTYFVELVSKTPPDETTWETQWPEEEKRMRQMALAQAENRRLEDYVAHLREQSLYQVDHNVFIQIMGAGEDQAQQGVPATAPALPDMGETPPSAEDGSAPFQEGVAPQTEAIDAEPTPETAVTEAAPPQS